MQEKQLKAMTKLELINHIREQDKLIKQLEEQVGQMKAKYAGVIGYGATKNPLVK